MTKDEKPKTPTEKTAADKWRELMVANPRIKETPKTGQGFVIVGAGPK